MNLKVANFGIIIVRGTPQKANFNNFMDFGDIIICTMIEKVINEHFWKNLKMTYIIVFFTILPLLFLRHSLSITQMYLTHLSIKKVRIEH